MTLYNQLQPKEAAIITTLANKGFSISQISRETGINRNKIKRCLDKCEIKKIKENLSKPWAGPHIKVTYSFNNWLTSRNLSKSNRAYAYAVHAEKVYIPFVNYCEYLYDEKKVLNNKVKRSADEFIKEFKKAHPKEPVPSRQWVYKMAKSPYYQFNHEWLPSTKPRKYRLKSDDEQLKATKYNSIEKRPPKELLRSEPGNYEIDSFIGQRKDKQALLTLMDIHTGNFYSRFYDRTMIGFRDAFKELIDIHNLEIKTLTMDNGGENNMLWTVVDRAKLFNCHAYCSGEKGTLENKHRMPRRVFKKGESLDGYTNDDLIEVNEFVNNYYSKKFGRV